VRTVRTAPAAGATSTAAMNSPANVKRSPRPTTMIELRRSSARTLTTSSGPPPPMVESICSRVAPISVARPCCSANTLKSSDFAVSGASKPFTSSVISPKSASPAVTNSEALRTSATIDTARCDGRARPPDAIEARSSKSFCSAVATRCASARSSLIWRMANCRDALRSISPITRMISSRAAGSARRSSTPAPSSATSCARARMLGSAANTTFSTVASASEARPLEIAIVSRAAPAIGLGASSTASSRSISPDISEPPAITTMLVRSSAANSGTLTTMPCWLSARDRARIAVCRLLTTSAALAFCTGTRRTSGTTPRSLRSANATKRSTNATASGSPTTVTALAPLSAITRTLLGSNATLAAVPSSPARVTASDLSLAAPLGARIARSASATRSAPVFLSGKLLTTTCWVDWPRDSAAMSWPTVSKSRSLATTMSARVSSSATIATRLARSPG
jgi:hypothetical protein